MTDVRAEKLLVAQASLVGCWQMLGAGMTVDEVRTFCRHARQVGDGVYMTGHGRMTREQKRWAAVLTAPDRYLAFVSAGAAWEIRGWTGSYEVVVRPGSGGPQRFGDVLVCRSTTLAGHTTLLDGLPITTPERTISDLASRVRGAAAEKMVREAIRLGLTTWPRMDAHLHQARGRRGVAGLRDYVARFSSLPFDRCRSDAESMGLQVLAEAGRPIPQVNVRIAGEEADFCWPDRRLIIEIDGPQWHMFAEEDARKTAIWAAAGWTVRRIPSGRVFDAPHELIALHDRPTSA
jgi:hypothetical protein